MVFHNHLSWLARYVAPSEQKRYFYNFFFFGTRVKVSFLYDMNLLLVGDPSDTGKIHLPETGKNFFQIMRSQVKRTSSS
jgi:hypothetical protein